MSLGKNLSLIRKKKGISQEELASKLNVSRQTISKWENDETIPNIYEVSAASKFLNVTIEELLNYEEEIKNIEESISRTDEATISKVDWTKVWGKRYPVLLEYEEIVDSLKYKETLDYLIKDLKNNYHYNNRDAFLVLKDILGKLYKEYTEFKK